MPAKPAKPTRLTKLEIARAVRAIVAVVYTARQARRAHPEGKFDSALRWYPSAIEDADGDGSRTRAPSRAWPYSYMLRCRTRQHCTVLVARALADLPVPEDVAHAVRCDPLITVAREALGIIPVPTPEEIRP